MNWHDKPDWEQWRKVLYLDPWQCTALAHDLTPETYVSAEMNPSTGKLVPKALHVTLIPEELRIKYYRVRERLGNVATIHRKEFVQWALNEDWMLPAEFLHIVEAKPNKLPPKQKNEINQEWQTKLESMARNLINQGRKSLATKCKLAGDLSKEIDVDVATIERQTRKTW